MVLNEIEDDNDIVDRDWKDCNIMYRLTLYEKKSVTLFLFYRNIKIFNIKYKWSNVN